MEFPTTQTLKTKAVNSLNSASCNPRRLLCIHIGVSTLLSALLFGLEFFLSQQINALSGLSGLGTRSALTTLQAVLRLAYTIFLPFWQMGYLFFTLKVAQGTSATPRTLLEGFRRFGPVLRFSLFLSLFAFAIVMLSTYVTGILYTVTPLSKPMAEQLAPLLSQMDTLDPILLETAVMEIVSQHALPITILFSAVCLIIGLPVFYRLRLCPFVLMDQPQRGALHALRTGRHLLKGNRLKMVKLDLHFWWFYLLELMVMAVAYADILLPALGISLPIGETVQFFAFYFLSLGLQFLLHYAFKNPVSVTYAHVYEAMKLPEKAE